MNTFLDLTFWVLESQAGWKVVWCKEFPQGGERDGNWMLIADGLRLSDACDFARRLRA